VKLPVFKYKPPLSPFKLYDEPLRVVVEFYKEHLRRDVESGRLTPLPWAKSSRVANLETEIILNRVVVSSF
jgi:hypothetical protein